MPVASRAAARTGARTWDAPGYLRARWIFLRALGLVFFTAFWSLAFQIHGLVGERGVLPAGDYLGRVAAALGPLERFWYVPSLLWIGPGDVGLGITVGAGLAGSLLLTANVWPRANVALCTLLFLSCVAVLQDFSAYQSDGMLLEAGFISVFLAPGGRRPGPGAADPPSRLARFMLVWEWCRIYFESGIVKLASGDAHWRDLTAMDEYYQNGPLPTWIGWFVQQLPHWYHAGTVLVTFAVELVVVWAAFGSRRLRLACFAVVSALQLGIIATANYAFLNYLVLALGVLLLDDVLVGRDLERGCAWLTRRLPRQMGVEFLRPWPNCQARPRAARRRGLEGAMLGLVFVASVSGFLATGATGLVALPMRWLAPFRIANAYGLFAVMTEGRWEIEFQGSRDGRTWVAYPFRYKPQDVRRAPGIYAPYQPRFDWNLWFASLGRWQQSTWILFAQQRLVEGSPSVLRLFRRDPFEGRPPAMVRTVRYRYWFTDITTLRATGCWWRRQELGQFTPTVARTASGGAVLMLPPP